MGGLWQPRLAGGGQRMRRMEEVREDGGRVGVKAVCRGRCVNG